MNRFYLVLLSLFFIVGLSPNISVAQNASCNGNRYLDLVFTNSDKTTVKFGENTTIGGNFKELMMDIYEPTSDAAAQRPAIVLAFGGSFIGGARNDLEDLCRYYAQKGYVTASIDYRLYDAPFFPFPDSLDMMEEVLMAISDMKAAIRYLRKDAATTNQFKIDPNFIFVGGVSAGAIVADHVAYISDVAELPPFIAAEVTSQGGLEGNTDDPADSNMGYSSEVQGVINMYGALYRASFIDANDPPIVSIHGTNDDVVPYGFGTANIGIPIITMNGSSSMHLVANNAGLWNHFISVPGGGHGDFMTDPFWADSLNNKASEMMEGIVCEGATVGIEQLSVDKHVVVYPNPTSSQLNIAFNNLNEQYSLSLYDQVGREITSIHNLTDDQFSFSKNMIPEAGMYQLRIVFEDTSLAPVVRKVVFF